MSLCKLFNMYRRTKQFFILKRDSVQANLPDFKKIEKWDCWILVNTKCLNNNRVFHCRIHFVKNNLGKKSQNIFQL